MASAYDRKGKTVKLIGQVRHLLLGAGIAVLCLLPGSQASAFASGTGPEPFFQGNIRMSLLFGGGRAFDGNYRVYGAGVGYYILDRLEVGLEAETWKGNEPGITRISPQVLYVFPGGRDARPYAGMFYRRSFIDGYKDLSDTGGRGGMLFFLGRSSYLGVGLAYERHIGCDRTAYASCSEVYPELSAVFIF